MFYTVLTEIFFKQTLNRYAEELLLFVFELCTLTGTDWEKEKRLSVWHPPSPALQHTFSIFMPTDQSLFISKLPRHLSLSSTVGLKSLSPGAEN